MVEKKKTEKKKKAPKPRHEITFYTYPKFLFVWPLIAVGFLLWPFAHYGVSSEVLAWVYGVTLVLVIVTMGLDINRNYTAFWLVVVVALWMMILWLGGKGVTLFADVYRFFADLNPQYSANLGLIVSIPLLVFYGIMWLWTRVNCKWRITHNEFEHYQFGRMDDSMARDAKRIRSSYPDFFELIVCLAGDLVIFDATGKRVIRRIRHVPLLPIVKKRINLILEATAVTTSDLVEDECEASEAAEGDEYGEGDAEENL